MHILKKLRLSGMFEMCLDSVDHWRGGQTSFLLLANQKAQNLLFYCVNKTS